MITNKIIVACDTPEKEQFLSLLKKLQGSATYIKIGMELYYSIGPDSIKMAKDHELDVFLDLKLHDIPNTVYKSCKTLSRLGVQMTNVHVAGGIEMMKAALEGLHEINPKTKLIGVTQLTSSDQNIMNNEILIPGDLEAAVLKYAQNAKTAGLHGIVCSAFEVKKTKKALGHDFLCVTPGIRLQGGLNHDQKRVMTPKEAISNGADHLVIGRAITNSTNIEQTFKEIERNIQI